jgi:hypothetical protein
MLVLDSSKVRQAVQGIIPWKDVGFYEKDRNDWPAWVHRVKDDAQNALMEDYSNFEDEGGDVDWSLFQSELEDEVFILLFDALSIAGYTLKED